MQDTQGLGHPLLPGAFCPLPSISALEDRAGDGGVLGLPSAAWLGVRPCCPTAGH